MDNLLLDLELARRIEIAEAEAAVAGAEFMKTAQREIAVEIAPVAGGFAVYCGAGSPITQAVGLGLHGAVSEEEFARMEDFYFSRGEDVRVETCPMADPSLIGLYGERGYRVTEFSNVMARAVGTVSSEQSVAGLEILRARPEEIDLWTLTVATGFAEFFPVTQELLMVMKMFANGRNMESYLARIDGRVVGGAALSLAGKTAGFFGASTLPAFRNRGVQTALLLARMRRAVEAGCDLAVSLALPGSHSQRNITRLGFRTLYTRVKFERAYRPKAEQVMAPGSGA